MALNFKKRINGKFMAEVYNSFPVGHMELSLGAYWILKEEGTKVTLTKKAVIDSVRYHIFESGFTNVCRVLSTIEYSPVAKETEWLIAKEWVSDRFHKELGGAA